MSLEQAILEAVRALPAEKRQEVLIKSVRGLWADLGISLSADEIEENQRDMWRNFPRSEI